MGFDEGAAGVIYFLLEYSNIYKDAVAFTAARNGLQWLMRSVKVRNGQLTWRRADQKREINYGFSSGVAGIAFTFLRAFQISSNSVYANFARKLLQGIPSKFTDNNLGQRSGLSGLGEVYLEAYHLLKEKVWLERATWIAQVIFHLKKSGFNNSTYWLVESEREPVANFMTGTSGILHFLLRYCYPDTIKFPFIK
jgi:lantibiotic modifying enzyme